MDSGRSPPSDRVQQWRVHFVEWYGLQFRDDYAGECGSGTPPLWPELIENKGARLRYTGNQVLAQ